LKDIVEVRPVGGHRLFVRFEDGVAGELDFVGRLRFEGVFAPLYAALSGIPVHLPNVSRSESL
jgi:hypothetical protein